MQNYQKTYYKGMGYDLDDINPNDLRSEISGLKAADIHHLKLGCSLKRQDYPVERLIMLTRDEHTKYGDKKQWYDFLFWMHLLTMAFHSVPINFENFPKEIVPIGDEYFTLLDFWVTVKESNYEVEVLEQTNCTINIYQDGRLIKTVERDTKMECIKHLIG